MGFQAILADGSIIAPAVDVLSGLILPSRANEKYKGTTGTCPHCQELRDTYDGINNPLVQQALAAADLSVRFKRAPLNGEQMLRAMHFAHRPGFLASAGACLLCRDHQLAHHAAAVKVIGRWAQSHWPGTTVKAEMQVMVPGAPPVRFRPDVSVTGPDGRRIACIEYQRSKEPFDSFKARDELRCAEFSEVLWFFRIAAYTSSVDHRDYLADRGRRFFKVFTDPDTQQLQYRPGERPIRRTPRRIDHALDACSESSLLRAIAPPDRMRRYDPLGIDTSLDMQEVKPIHPRPISSHQRRTPAVEVIPQTLAQRLAHAKRFRLPISKEDRIEHALTNRIYTAFDIQRWDHSQRFGALLSIRDIEKVLRNRFANGRKQSQRES